MGLGFYLAFSILGRNPAIMSRYDGKDGEGQRERERERGVTEGVRKKVTEETGKWTKDSSYLN